MLYILSTFMVVFSGREITMNNGSKVVIASFVMQFASYLMTIVASHSDALQWLELTTGWK